MRRSTSCSASSALSLSARSSTTSWEDHTYASLTVRELRPWSSMKSPLPEMPRETTMVGSGHVPGAELDGKTIRIEYATGGPGSASISKRISRAGNDRRPQRDPRDGGRYRRNEGRRGGSNNRGGNKRRFNDRVREQRSYRSRR